MKRWFRALVGSVHPLAFAVVLAVGVAAAMAQDVSTVTQITNSVAAGEAATAGADPTTAVPTAAESQQIIDQKTADDAKAAAQSIENAKAAVKALISNTDHAIKDIQSSGKFRGLGNRLIAILGTVTVIWNVLKNMVLKSSVTQLAADLVFPFVVIMLSVTLANPATAAGISSFVESLTNGFGVAPTTDAFIDQMLRTMQSVWQQHATSGIPLSGAEFASLGLELLTLFFLIIGTVFGIGTMLLARFQVAFAVALAPVFVPWLLWKPSEFLFHGWLTFLLKGAMAFVAVGAMTFTLSNGIASMATIFPATKTIGMDTVIGFGGMALMALMVAFLISKAMEIGGGIIGGGPSGLGGIGRVAGTGGGMMATGVLKPMSGMAKGGSKILGPVGHAKLSNAPGKLGELAAKAAPRQGSFQRLVYDAAGGKSSPRQAAAAAAPAAASATSTPGLRKLQQPSAWARGPGSRTH